MNIYTPFAASYSVSVNLSIEYAWDLQIALSLSLQ